MEEVTSGATGPNDVAPGDVAPGDVALGGAGASDGEARLLAALEGWLRALPGDVLALAGVLESPEVPRPLRGAAAEAVGYVLRSRHLIPEGLEALGHLENAVVLRAVAQRACAGGAELGLTVGEEPFGRLAAEAPTLAELLGEDAERFGDLPLAAAERRLPGARSAEQLLEDAEQRSAALAELREWASSWVAPELGDGAEELVKLRSFFRTRARRAEREPAEVAAEAPAPEAPSD